MQLEKLPEGILLNLIKAAACSLLRHPDINTVYEGGDSLLEALEGRKEDIQVLFQKV